MMRCLCVGASPEFGDCLAGLVRDYSFDGVYAVDGGYRTLRKADLEPTEVFGDFDSLGYVPAGADAVFDWHKDFTDMDWALSHALEGGFDEVFLVGGLGGRTDHAIGNLQLMAKYARQGLKVWSFGEDEVVVCLAGGGDLSRLQFSSQAQGTFSLLPHSDVVEGVIEEGLEWELSGARLTNSELLGISNEFKGEPVRVSIGSGTAWVIFPESCLPFVTWGAASDSHD